jgi:hypothetical protein
MSLTGSTGLVRTRLRDPFAEKRSRPADCDDLTATQRPSGDHAGWWPVVRLVRGRRPVPVEVIVASSRLEAT